VKASTSERGCCPACGAPWLRAIKQVGGEWREVIADHIDGWAPSCRCDAGEPVPCWVLDPFGGTCTTGLVASKLARHSSLIELGPQWAAAGAKRLRTEGLPVELPEMKRRRQPL
jgi:hypothetical protein